jgi:hypothetical protein
VSLERRALRDDHRLDPAWPRSRRPRRWAGAEVWRGSRWLAGIPSTSPAHSMQVGVAPRGALSRRVRKLMIGWMLVCRFDCVKRPPHVTALRR